MAMEIFLRRAGGGAVCVAVEPRSSTVEDVLREVGARCGLDGWALGRKGCGVVYLGRRVRPGTALAEWNVQRFGVLECVWGLAGGASGGGDEDEDEGGDGATVGTAPNDAASGGDGAPKPEDDEDVNYNNMTPEAVFEKIDTDNSGRINLEEFKIMLGKLKINMSSAKALKYFKMCDADDSGEKEATSSFRCLA